ncbi:hypothetical protein [Methanothrix sp.]
MELGGRQAWPAPARGREEAWFLRVPCMALRDDIKRPETIEVGG